MSIKDLMQRHMSYAQGERLRDLAYQMAAYSGIGSLLARMHSGGAAVLMYHSIGGEDLFPDNVLATDIFEEQMALVSSRFTVRPLGVVVDASMRGTLLPRGTLAITFDDGYLDFVHNALPILERFAVPATIFVPTGTLAGRPLFFDVLYGALAAQSPKILQIEVAGDLMTLNLTRDQDLADSMVRLALRLRTLGRLERDACMHRILADVGADPQHASARYLQVEDLQRLPDLIAVGSHAVDHYNLAALNDEDLHHELQSSRETLERLSNRKVDLLAYPFGKAWSFDDRVAAFARRAGYRAAMSTVPGLVNSKSDCFALPRFGVSRGLSRLKLNALGLHL